MNALAEALRTTDSCGRVPAEAAEVYRAAAAGCGSRKVRNDRALQELFGSFESLAPGVRQALQQAVADDDRWRMRGYAMGPWHTATTRLLWGLSRKASSRRLGLLARLAELLAVSVQSGPARTFYALHRRQLLWQARHSRRPEIAALLYHAGIEARELAIGYATGLPQPAGFRGYWQDRGSNIAYGTVVGLDLLLTGSGCWYVEGNLNFGMSNTRTALYEQDPFVANLIDFTAGRGYETLVFVNNLSSGMNRIMAGQFEEAAARQGLKIRFVEDACIPGSGYAQSFEIPSADQSNTLVVRTRGYRTSLDYIFDNKRASQRALELYQQVAAEPDLRLPSSGPEPVLGDSTEDGPFPNLVYKFPERDAGKGIAFLKASSPEHARQIVAEAKGLCRPKKFTDLLYSFVDDRDGVFQSYICSPLDRERRLSKIRSHVLLSPAGCRFLSAHRVVSRYPVPETLPLGLVADDRPYLVNLSRSSAYERLSAEEEGSVKAASLAIARGLCWAVEQGFRSTDAEEKTGGLPG